MKRDRINTEKKQVKADTRTHRPDVRDNLDSRKNEEQLFRGDDVTHNRKDAHNRPRKGK